MDAKDYFAIQNLLYRYCECVDQGDFAGMAALFADADVVLPGTGQWYRRDPAGLAAIYREWVRIYPDGTPRTRHVTTNVIIEPDGADRARARSYVTVFQAAPGRPLQPILGGRNHDRFEKVGGAWCFAERRIESDLFGDLSAHLLKDFGPVPNSQ